MAKKDKRLYSGQVIIPAGHPNPPEPHEIEVAWILARHFNTTVEFLIPADDYKRKTADIVLLGVEWEIKSPTGKSRNTVGYQFRRASKQSKYIVFDGRRTPISDTAIQDRIRFEMAKRISIKRVLFVAKSSEILEAVL
jgi:hypothetical protein